MLPLVWKGLKKSMSVYGYNLLYLQRKLQKDTYRQKKKKLKKTNSYIKWIGTRELKKKLFNKYLIKIKYLNYFK